MKVKSFNACGLMEYSLPNSRLGFFDECISQKFYLKDPSDGLLIRYRDDVNNIIEDAYGNANGYQSHVMDISGELTTFCVEGPRFF